MHAGSDPPNEGGVVSVRGDAATESANRGGVGPAVVANESSLLDLTGKMIPCPLQALFKTCRPGHWIDEIDDHRRYEGVHLRPWTFKARLIGVVSKPITLCLLMVGEDCSRPLGTKSQICACSLLCLGTRCCQHDPQQQAGPQSPVRSHRCSGLRPAGVRRTRLGACKPMDWQGSNLQRSLISRNCRLP